MVTSTDELVLQLACEKGWLCEDQVSAARAATDGASEGQAIAVLVAEGALAPDAAIQLLAERFAMARVDLAGLQVPGEVLACVPRELAARHQLIPVGKEGETLRVAIGNPLETEGIDTLAHVLNTPVEPVLAEPAQIAAALERHFGHGERGWQDWTEKLPEVDAVAEKPAITTETESDAPIVQLVQAIIQEAVRRRASDIHLEPLEKRFRVRYRVDGVLLEGPTPPKRTQLAVVSRVKIMANISIAEKRVPQDGRIQLTLHGRALDLRVSTLPTAHGESVVMRLLDREGLKPGLPDLGFLPDDRAQFERLVRLADGIVLVTGPTGSGKTTTLYSCLHHLNRSNRKIITVEDPVEYQLSGVNQVPVRHEIGMTFASALRAMLRQAPNVVMVGEIRDFETAEIAINASLTGHLVFSTLHTNDAPGAVTRLIDLGVKPFLVATSLRAVMAQRLVRKICEKCRAPHTPSAAELRALGLDGVRAEPGMFARGLGCAACNGTGYRGRMGLFEIFAVNEELQRMIHDRAGVAALRAKARALGLRTLREDGARKASAGLTTIEEVVSITVGDAS